MNIAETLNRWGAVPRCALAVGAGALAVLGHAPFHFTAAYALSVSALLCLLDAAAQGPRPMRRGFTTGLYFGIGHFAVGMHWVAAAFEVDPDTWGALWGFPAAFGLGVLMSLFWAVGCAVAMALWTRDWRRVGVFAAALGATEYLRGQLFGGLPWLLPAYIWTPGEPISQFASLGGAYALSIATLAVCVAPAISLTAHPRSLERFTPVLVAALVLGLAWGWGARRLQTAPITLPGASPIVRVVDSGLTQAEKWNVGGVTVLQRYIAASDHPDRSRAEIVVWPEGAVPWVNAHLNADFMRAFGQALGDRVAIVGLTRCEPVPACDDYYAGRSEDNESLRLFNSAAVIDGVGGQARVSQIYDKHRLVPFGEFIPLWSLFSRLNIAPLQQIGAGFVAGPTPGRLVVPGAPPVTALICYEAIFPGFTPRGPERPGWLVSLTNDAWFGNGLGPAQHFVMARYRSIEEGLPMARAASGGVSGIIDAHGRVVEKMTQASIFGGVEAQLPPSLSDTGFTRAGSTLTLVLLLLMAGIRLAPNKARSRDDV